MHIAIIMTFKSNIRSYFVIEDRNSGTKSTHKLTDFRSYFIIEKRQNSNDLETYRRGMRQSSGLRNLIFIYCFGYFKLGKGTGKIILDPREKLLPRIASAVKPLHN